MTKYNPKERESLQSEEKKSLFAVAQPHKSKINDK